SGARTAGIVAVLLIIDILKESELKVNYRLAARYFCTAIILLNVFNLYYSSYLGTEPLKCNAIVQSGALKGIPDESEKIEKYGKMRETLESVKDGNDETITCISSPVYYYLESDLKPNTNYLDSTASFTSLSAYFDKYYGKPDIIIIDKTSDVYKSDEFGDFINSGYIKKAELGDSVFYHINE
nr:hypothetical protein [Eubacterium sp.]